MAGFALNLLVWWLYTLGLYVLALTPVAPVLLACLTLAVVAGARMEGWM
jgi:uncharacterized membrane protein